METVIVNVYKHDDTFFKTPSLCEFSVEYKENWKQTVEEMISNKYTPRSDYFLSFEYKRIHSEPKTLKACA